MKTGHTFTSAWALFGTSLPSGTLSARLRFNDDLAGFSILGLGLLDEPSSPSIRTRVSSTAVPTSSSRRLIAEHLCQKNGAVRRDLATEHFQTVSSF